MIEFLTYAKVQAASYTTNNVIMTMGETKICDEILVFLRNCLQVKISIT